MSTFPPRCFTCGKVLILEKYQKLLEEGYKEDNAMDLMGLKRFCCRRMFLGYVPEIDESLTLYSKYS